MCSNSGQTQWPSPSDRMNDGEHTHFSPELSNSSCNGHTQAFVTGSLSNPGLQMHSVSWSNSWAGQTHLPKSSLMKPLLQMHWSPSMCSKAGHTHFPVSGFLMKLSMQWQVSLIISSYNGQTQTWDCGSLSNLWTNDKSVLIIFRNSGFLNYPGAQMQVSWSIISWFGHTQSPSTLRPNPGRHWQWPDRMYSWSGQIHSPVSVSRMKPAVISKIICH